MTAVRALALLLALAGLVVPGPARAAVTLGETAPVTPGAAHLVAAADPATADLRIVEQVDGAQAGVPATATPGGLEADVPWTCRTVRTFVAVAGDERSAPLAVWTPACAQRLRIAAVHRVGLGGNLRVTLIDRWEQGGFDIDACAQPPGGLSRCERVALAPGQYVAHAVFRATETGAWHVSVSDPWHAVALPAIAVHRQRGAGRPVVLFTGDSMMLAPQRVLRRRLAAGAKTVSDVYVGSGISSPLVTDWGALPRDQVRAYRPDATVISLGTDDTGDLVTRDGEAVPCCGDDFKAIYARRARAMMRTYLRGGRGAVVWLNVPLARDPRRWPSSAAVNTAVAQAAVGFTRVRIVDQAAILTPAGYEEFRTVDGEPVRLRAVDGIHMARLGAQLVSTPVLAALHQDLGVVAVR